jgi:hypothetical protein
LDILSHTDVIKISGVKRQQGCDAQVGIVQHEADHIVGQAVRTVPVNGLLERDSSVALVIDVVNVQLLEEVF